MAEDSESGDPPAYSTSPAQLGPHGSASLTAPCFGQVPGLLAQHLPWYLPPYGQISKDLSTLTVFREDVEGDLATFLRAQLAVPPRPVASIRGTHKAVHEATILDFDISLDVTDYIHPLAGDASLHYVVNEAPVEKGAKAESVDVVTNRVERFEASTARLKRYEHHDSDVHGMLTKTRCRLVLQRTVSNWDTHYLEGCMRNLLCSLKYEGKVEINFKYHHSVVIIKPRETLTDWTMKPFISSQDVKVEAIWPYANTENGSSYSRRALRMTESDWWRVWREPIKDAILTKKKGWIGKEALMDSLTSQTRRGKERRSAWWG